METVTSSDGTTIAFDRLGDGPPAIAVCGAMCDRALMRPTAEELAKHFTVFSYDRRGRGDSGDTAPYAVEREIEDMGTLIAEAGGTASVYGHSSGAGLALHAAAHGLPISKLVLHETPYNPDGEEWKHVSREYAERLEAVLSEGRRGDAVELFFTTAGMPQEMVDGIRRTRRWAELEAMAPSLAYDSEIMGDSTGGTVPTELVGRVRNEILVLIGGASPEWMLDVGEQVADALPNGRLKVLEGQEHVVPPEVLVPVLEEFFAGRNGARQRDEDGEHLVEQRKFFLRRVVVVEYVYLDGVVQAPGTPARTSMGLRARRLEGLVHGRRSQGGDLVVPTYRPAGGEGPLQAVGSGRRGAEAGASEALRNAPHIHPRRKLGR